MQNPERDVNKIRQWTDFYKIRKTMSTKLDNVLMSRCPDQQMSQLDTQTGEIV